METLSDVEMTQIGNRLLVTRGHTTMPRIAGVTLNAATDPDIVDLLATADPRTPSRYRCRHVSGDRQVFSRLMFCTAIRHTIGPDLWEARLSPRRCDAVAGRRRRRILEQHRDRRSPGTGRSRAWRRRDHTMNEERD